MSLWLPHYSQFHVFLEEKRECYESAAEERVNIHLF